MKQYDVIVIGSGGGSKISSYASMLGLKCALVEEGALGGTCLNRGCIPSKMLIYPGNISTLIDEADKFNISVKKGKINFSKIVNKINKTSTHDSKSMEKAYKKGVKNIDFYQGHGKFLSDKVIEVNGKKLTGKKIYIATGAKPSIPKIDGLQNTPYWTSTEALTNTKLPKHLIIIGGGYIACELGHAYNALGSKVTMIVRSELLKHEDKDIRTAFAKHFKPKVIYSKTKKVKYNKSFQVYTDKGTIKGDALLIATGVKPNTDNLGLENTKIKTNKGFIKTNKHLETTVKNVYALGDCVGNYLFRHSVNFEAEYLFYQHYQDEKKTPIKYPPMPHAVFSYPEIAGVGKTEDELNGNYVVGLHKYVNSGMGMARMSSHGFVKLIFDKKTERLIGAHIIGDEASTMIHQLIYAMTFKAKVEDLVNMIYIHPALPEVVRNAGRNALEKF